MYILVDHAKSSVGEYMRCASFCVEWAGELEYWSTIELIEVDAVVCIKTLRMRRLRRSSSPDTLFLRMLQKVGAFFANHHAGNAWIDADYGREDGGISYSQTVNAFYTQLCLNNC